MEIPPLRTQDTGMKLLAIPALTLLCGVSSLCAQQGGDTPAVLLERGVFAIRAQLDLNTAKSILRRVAEQPECPPRIAAEALWHMSRAYSLQGSDGPAVDVLQHLAQRFPSAEPYTTAATRHSVTISEENAFFPLFANSADQAAAGDLLRIVQAAHALGDAGEMRAALAALAGYYESILFELRLAQRTSESDKERRQRLEAQQRYSEAVAWTKSTQQTLRSGVTAVPSLTVPPALLERAHCSDPGDYSAVIYARRDAFTAALGTGLPKETAAALRDLETAIGHFTEAPDNLPYAAAFGGELNAARAAAAQSARGESIPALRTWRMSRHILHSCGISGAGFIFTDARDIPAGIMPQFVAAVMQLESTLAALRDEEDSAAALKQLDTAREVFTALLAEADTAPCRHRIQRVLGKINPAVAFIKADNPDSAWETLAVEIYLTR